MRNITIVSLCLD